MDNRCTALLDYRYDMAIRCALKKGHTGIHKTKGWEPAKGSTGLLVKTLQKRAAR